MEKPNSLQFFDLHNHPFNKGAVSATQETYLSWDPVEIDPGATPLGECQSLEITDEYQIEGEEIFESLAYSKRISFPDIMRMAKQIFNSQSSINDLHTSSTLSVTSLIAMEQAYAETWFLRCLLPAISPLDSCIVRAVIKKLITYNSLFNNERNQITKTKAKKDFYILKSINDFREGEFNTILSIEGAHNLQVDHEHPELIPKNLKELKKNTDYKFFYLTLTHLTRQPAAVHCFGTYIRVLQGTLNINLTPNYKFQPDPLAKGLSAIGENTIHEAYNPDPYTMLIDIKHMSYASRQMFYIMRDENEAYKKLPILATHMGVTGHSFEDAIYEGIDFNQTDDNGRIACDRVYWVPSINKYMYTKFNPWTINLFDDDILKILESGGMIGLNLDQRILGVGKFPGEYMSPEDVKYLHLYGRTKGVDNTDSIGLDEFNQYYDDDDDPISFDPFFQQTVDEMKDEKSSMRKKNPRHIDYLFNNIAHIMKVGFKAGYGRLPGWMHVCDAISIGSDFDGMTDPINLPKVEGGDKIDRGNWVTAAKFDKLRTELYHSLEKFLKDDPDLNQFIDFIPENLIEKICVLNGWEFLNKHFQ